MCEHCLLDPTMDFIFKGIFGNENEPEILICFLNAVLEPYSFVKPYDPIVSITLKNTEITKKSIEDKYSILDVKAVTSKGEHIDIEIQREDTTDMLRRSLYYLDEMFTEQLESGYQYHKLSRVVSIVIMNYTCKFIENEHFHNVYRYQNIRSNQELTDLHELHYIELDKLEISDKDDVLQLFLEFLKDPNSPYVENKTGEIQELSKAKEKLSKLSRDPNTREEFKLREKALKDKASMLGDAERKGIAKGMELGKEIGREEGVTLGKELGREEGREEGVTLGKELGREEGIELGMEKGIQQEKILSIQRAIREGCSKELTLSICNCSEELYQIALEQMG